MSGQAVEEEDDTNDSISGQVHPPTSEGETSMSKDDTTSDDSSNESDDMLMDDPFNSLEEDDRATSKSATNTSLGINLELVLEISEEDMLMDKVSTPCD